MDESESKSRIEFKEKLKTINFGTVPGAYKDTNRYDQSAIEQLDWPSKEEIEDNRADVRHAPEKEVKLEGQPEYKH